VKFLVDAQLPLRLARSISTAGHDVVHTSELRDGNRTTDAVIARLADSEDRVVVTKDRDFRDGLAFCDGAGWASQPSTLLAQGEGAQRSR
jgi:predicted nuclease of predicted toxin-antitoxin system